MNTEKNNFDVLKLGDMISDIVELGTYDCYQIAEALIEKGVLVPPVNPGDEVYAVVEDNDGVSFLECYEVRSVCFDGKAWSVMDKYGTDFIVGSELCIIDKGDADIAVDKANGKI